MSKAGGAKGGAGRDSRLASALRDNLRRRKTASRPVDEAAAGPVPDGRPNATPSDKTADGGRKG